MAIKTIVVVGGGTAGWMSAAAFAKFAQNKEARVILVESEDIGTVGVGEATIPPFVQFNEMLGINEAEMLSHVGGTFKLGIQFVNWGKQEDSYFHPFGDYGYQIDGVAFHHIWMKYRKSGDPRPLFLFNAETIAAQYRKFGRTEDSGRDDLPPINYAYHLDAGKYAQFLRQFSEVRGVERIEGMVDTVSVNNETGDVESLLLKDGQTIEGDFFIDCTGFRGLLIEQALKTGYEDWTRWLPCDRAWAVPCEQTEDPLPYTRATAHSAGWQWRVPLQHRLGNGHVFCSSFMDDQEAQDILMNNLDGKPLADPKLLRFVTGHRKKFWNKNVVAIGLASGFMEPLESTSIHLISTGVAKLLATFSLRGVSEVQRNTYNRLTLKEYCRIRDFLILHYNATKRDDSDFWNHCRTMEIPDTLKEKIDLFKWNGQIFREEDELFTSTSWSAVMLGQGIAPDGYNPLADVLDQASLRKEVSEIEKSIKYLVYHMPSHGDYLRKYCPVAQ